MRIDDAAPVYVTDDTPEGERRYRARLHLDPSGLAMAEGDAHFLFHGYSGASMVVLALEIRSARGEREMRAWALDGASAWARSPWRPLGEGPQAIGLDWRAASAAEARDGSLALWRDGEVVARLGALDNHLWRVDRVRLGAVEGVDGGTSGTYLFDAFRSRRRRR